MTEKKNENNSKDELSVEPKAMDNSSEEEIDSFEELGIDVDLKTNFQDDLAVNEDINDTAIEAVLSSDEVLSHYEIDSKLDEVLAAERKFKAQQASKPSEIESISVNDLTIEDNDSEKTDLECLNCAVLLEGPYCHNCGQPDRHFIRFFPKVLWEMINEAFDLDSRALRTLLPLYFSPGRLSMEYFSGRRARYVNPLRLYIILSVLFFISISFFTALDDDIVISEGSNGVNVSVRSGEDTTKETPDGEQIDLVDEKGRLKVTLGNDELWDVETNPLTFKGVFSDEITKELNQFFWSMGIKLDKALKDDPSDLLDEFLNVIPQLMFILLPLFALLLKLTYIFKKRYYMEHLIVALHNHCFMFFSLLLIILMSYLEDNLSGPAWLIEGIGYLIIAMILWIPLNLYIGMKRVYAQGYIMTFLKFIFIGFAYEFLLTITAASAFVLGLAKM
ncbi:MAG: hypothetical protein ACI9N9_001002 [Enterobacterales bacterium]|jgi:hypothetical protein